jgi:glycine oxidase
MSDCLVVGGGVIGLSVAYELAGHGLRVRIIDAGQVGQEASWAGAGILPPASAAADNPLERLATLANELHTQWSRELCASTGIDNGYRRSGAIYLERQPDAAKQLERFARAAHERGIIARGLSAQALSELEPVLQPRGSLEAVYLVPDECQIRNPRHLKALVAGCVNRGVEITPGVAADDFEIDGGRVRAVRTSLGFLAADNVVVTTGSWTAPLARKLAVSPAIKPIRGQMVLLKLPRRVLQRIVNEGSRYLVPRDDGRVLVGSTEEDAGFDRSTTAGAIRDLLDFASSLVPELDNAQVERSWAGLRPSTRDGLPYLGRVPGLDNAFVAAGHFRGGLQLSTATAVVMSQLVRGEPTSVELSAFRVDRDKNATDASATHRGRRQREIRSSIADEA